MSEDVPRFAGMIDELLDVALPRFPGRSLLVKETAVRLLGLRRFQALVDTVWGRATRGGYMREVLRELAITWRVASAGSISIPQRGPLIAVANHPTGILEGLILAEILRPVRPDVKLMALHLLSVLPGLRDELILVDPYGRDDSPRFNLGPMRRSLDCLRGEGTLAMFPAGAVSKPDLRSRKIIEAPWTPTLAGLIRRSGATVLPFHFAIDNRLPFHLIGMIDRGLQAPLIVRELLNKKGREVEVTMGEPIPYDELARFGSDTEMVEFLRRSTCALGEDRA